MSKIKKKRPDSPSTGISEMDIKFIKIINTAGWLSLLAFGIFFAIWGLFDMALKLIDIDSDSPLVFAYLVYTGTLAVFSITLGTKLDKDRDKKREYFLEWMVGVFLLVLFSIFALAVYQW